MRSPEDFEKIACRDCWPDRKIVVGLVTNPANCAGWVEDEPLKKTLMALRKNPVFGGVMGW